MSEGSTARCAARAALARRRRSVYNQRPVTPTTVAFLPEVGALGADVNCVALAEVLRERGVRCLFVVDESFAGLLEAKGFDEVLLRVADPPADDDGGADGWAEYVRVTAPEFRKPTIEQVATVVKPIWETLVAQGRYAHERLVEVWREQAPDVIVTDNVSAFPSILTSGVPWVRAVSCNELELQDRRCRRSSPATPRPAATTGTPSARSTAAAAARSPRSSTRSAARPARRRSRRSSSPTRRRTSTCSCSRARSTYARRARPIGAHWQRLESTVRAPDRPFDVDRHVPGEGALVYLSLGSLGSMDVALMQRIVDVLAATPHRVIVSLGPLGDQLRLGERMYGEEFLPQTAIVPQCDVLITHGGNNTFCEALHFGVPTIALPLFWDQYDNAQRAADCGVGVRLPTYAFAPEDLTGAIDRLLADDALRARLSGTAQRIQAAPGQVRAAEPDRRPRRGGPALASATRAAGARAQGVLDLVARRQPADVADARHGEGGHARAKRERVGVGAAEQAAGDEAGGERVARADLVDHAGDVEGRAVGPAVRVDQQRPGPPTLDEDLPRAARAERGDEAVRVGRAAQEQALVLPTIATSTSGKSRAIPSPGLGRRPQLRAVVDVEARRRTGGPCRGEARLDGRGARRRERRRDARRVEPGRRSDRGLRGRDVVRAERRARAARAPVEHGRRAEAAPVADQQARRPRVASDPGDLDALAAGPAHDQLAELCRRRCGRRRRRAARAGRARPRRSARRRRPRRAAARPRRAARRGRRRGRRAARPSARHAARRRS